MTNRDHGITAEGGNGGEIFFPAEDLRARQWRDDPDAARIEVIRKAFPTEAEYDDVLTRKMARRNSGHHVIPSIGEMTAYVESFLRDHIGSDFTISDGGWLTGGASKIQFVFTLAWRDGATPRTERLVVRMEPSESLNSTSRRRELEIIAAMEGVVPVPRAFWMDWEGKWFPQPAIIYSYVTGSTKPSRDRARVSGTGMEFPPELREVLGPQFVAHLAAIHTRDLSGVEMKSFDRPQVGTTQSALWQLNRMRRVWEEDRGEDWPAVEHVVNWLQDNLPVLDVVSAIHGDYRSGNFLFDEPTGRMTAWLDWERSYLGDRHRDLAWASTRLFGNMAEDGKTFLVSGLVPEERFFEEYEKLSGLSVDPKRLHYYRVFNTCQLVVSSLGTSYRVARLHKSHQDVMLAIVEGAAFSLGREMLNALEGGSHG